MGRGGVGERGEGQGATRENLRQRAVRAHAQRAALRARKEAARAAVAGLLGGASPGARAPPHRTPGPRTTPRSCAGGWCPVEGGGGRRGRAPGRTGGAGVWVAGAPQATAQPLPCALSCDPASKARAAQLNSPACARPSPCPASGTAPGGRAAAAGTPPGARQRGGHGGVAGEGQGREDTPRGRLHYTRSQPRQSTCSFSRSIPSAPAGSSHPARSPAQARTRTPPAAGGTAGPCSCCRAGGPASDDAGGGCGVGCEK